MSLIPIRENGGYIQKLAEALDTTSHNLQELAVVHEYALMPVEDVYDPDFQVVQLVTGRIEFVWCIKVGERLEIVGIVDQPKELNYKVQRMFRKLTLMEGQSRGKRKDCILRRGN